MARRPGSGRKDQNIEYAECHRSLYGQAITSANQMGQDPFVWFNDAIVHHVYRCEVLQAQTNYRQACHDAAVSRQPSPLQADFMPARPAPTITIPGGQGSAAGNRRSYRP